MFERFAAGLGQGQRFRQSVRRHFRIYVSITKGQQVYKASQPWGLRSRCIEKPAQCLTKLERGLLGAVAKELHGDESE